MSLSMSAMNSRRLLKNLAESFLSWHSRADDVNTLLRNGCSRGKEEIGKKTEFNFFHPLNYRVSDKVSFLHKSLLLWPHAFSEFLYLIRCQSIHPSVKSGVNSQNPGQKKICLDFLSAKLATRKVVEFY